VKFEPIRFSLVLSLVAIAALAACAGARPAGSAPDTDLSVLDEGGGSVPGTYEMWGPREKDNCETSGSGCSVALPEGDYYLTFRKLRGGRLASAGGGNAGGDRSSGCLRARVHLVPGVEIKCKKIAEYNCQRAATETMDCGPASSAKYGAAQHKPVPPPDLPPEQN
jgi:hypothetical protein